MQDAAKSAVDKRTLIQRFGRNVRRARQVRGLSQEDLADLAGLHRTYVGSVERGERNPTLLNITRLAQVLGIQPSELMPQLPLEEPSDAPVP